jgi:hopanoid biosynthesis associated protein HpnK
MPVRLIVNADDFGFTGGVNAGIIHAHQCGIVTSTTIMANGDAFEEAVALALQNPALGVGVHLAAVGGSPVSDPRHIPSLVDKAGLLPRTLTALLLRLARGAVKMEHVEREFRAQVELVISRGITPTHLDSHKHTHTHPLVMEALARVAREFGIPCVRRPFERPGAGRFTGPAARSRRGVHRKQRILALAVAGRQSRFERVIVRYNLRAPDRFFGVALTGLLDSAALRDMIGVLPEGTSELMCHPATYGDDLDRASTRLKRERERERDALTDESVKLALQRSNIATVSFRDLR